jgi:DNA repair protein RadC
MEYTLNSEGAKVDVIKKIRKMTNYSRMEVKINYRMTKLLPTEFISSGDAHQFCIQIWDKSTIDFQEEIVALYLNARGQIITFRKISKGSIQSSLLFIQLICGIAINSFATYVIIVHNHPTGNLQPSPSDFKNVLQVRKALFLYGIELNDSLIISREAHYSIRDEYPYLFTQKLSYE